MCLCSGTNQTASSSTPPPNAMTTDLIPKPASGAVAHRPAHPAWATSPRAERVRTHLAEADTHLAEAWQRLDARPVDHAAVLTEVLASFRASLLAFLNDYGAELDPEATLATLGEQAMRNSGVLDTAVRRAMALAQRAPAIQSAAQLALGDREDVETGCYTARNLIDTVRTVLPDALAGRAAPALGMAPSV